MPDHTWIGLTLGERKTLIEGLSALRPPRGKRAKEIDALTRALCEPLE